MIRVNRQARSDENVYSGIVIIIQYLYNIDDTLE